MQQKSTAYLAGPDVFYPDAQERSKTLKKVCAKYNINAHFPLDTQINEDTKKSTALHIVRSNIKSIEKSDYIFANFSNFRGTIDSGTAWEVGFALALKKKIFLYSDTPDIIPDLIKNVFAIPAVTDFKIIFRFWKTMGIFNFKDLYNIKLMDPYLLLHCTVDLNPLCTNIQDANPESSFILGYRFGKGLSTKAIISDLRTQVEKFGKEDTNGIPFEDFDYPVNIMIGVTTKIEEIKK